MGGNKLGAVHKIRQQSEGRVVCAVRNFADKGWGGGGLQMRTSALFDETFFEVFEI